MNFQVQLTFTKQARLEAIEMRKMRGIETPHAFEGPLFECATAFVEGQFLRVNAWDSLEDYKACRPATAQYNYALSNIARYKVFQ